MKTTVIAIVAITALVGLALLLANTITGFSARRGGGYDWDYQAAIGYGAYARTYITKNPCEEQINRGNIASQYTVPRTYGDAMQLKLNVQTDCTYAYPLTGYPGYCCIR